MGLNVAQQQILKTDIAADATLSALPNNDDGNQQIADAYNLNASPAYTVWKSNVTITDTGKIFNGTEWAGMTTANHTRLQTVAQWLPGGYNAALPDIRAMFNDIWSGAGGTSTRNALLVLWKRLARRGEKLYASGTGTDTVPSTLTFEGPISATDVSNARNLP